MFRRPKAILSLILAAVMLSSCGAKGSSSDSAGESSSEAVTTTRAVVTLPQDSSLADGSSQSDENKEPSDITPAMWKITADDGHEIYFIGSMHALKDECYPLPDRVTDAYNKSDVVACEMDLNAFNNDLAKQLTLAREAMYDDKDETLAQHLSADTFDGLTAFFDETVGKGAMETYKHYKPWMILAQCESLLSRLCGIDPYTGLDMKVTEMALNDSKEIYEVEGADFQFGMLMNLSDELYDMLLAGYNADNTEELKQINSGIYEAWKIGDLPEIQELLADEAELTFGDVTDEQKKLLDDYNATMVYNRNLVMADAAEKLLKEHKNTFFMVGLAHFIGEGGIIDLLEKRGYKVETV